MGSVASNTLSFKDEGSTKAKAQAAAQAYYETQTDIEEVDKEIRRLQDRRSQLAREQNLAAQFLSAQVGANVTSKTWAIGSTAVVTARHKEGVSILFLEEGE